MSIWRVIGSSDLSDPTAAAHTDTKRDQKYLSSFFFIPVPYVTLSVMTFPGHPLCHPLCGRRSRSSGRGRPAGLEGKKSFSCIPCSLHSCIFTGIFYLNFLNPVFCPAIGTLTAFCQPFRFLHRTSSSIFEKS